MFSVAQSETMIQIDNWYICNVFIEAKTILESLASVTDDTLSEATIKPELLISDNIGVNFITRCCLHNFILSRVGDTSSVELSTVPSAAFLNSLLITSNDRCGSIPMMLD